MLDCQSLSLKRWNHNDLAAPYWRFYWNDRIGGSVIVHGRKTRLSPKRFYIVPPDTNFDSRLDRPVTHFYIHFTSRIRYLASSKNLHSFPANDFLLQKIAALRASRPPSTRLSLIANLLAGAALDALPESGFLQAKEDTRIKRALDRLDDNWASPISNAALAREASMNVNAFIRLFSQQVGESPQAYLIARRIEGACIELIYTEKTIEDIAESCGFCNRYHFSNMFKKNRGTSPAKYRKQALLSQTKPD